MMHSINGVVTGAELESITTATGLRFKDVSLFTTPEALIIKEQRILPDNILLDCCNKEYRQTLGTPKASYVTPEVVEHFKNTNAVPISYSPRDGIIVLGVLPEFETSHYAYKHLTIKIQYIPIYYYVELYTQYYGNPAFLADLAAYDKFAFVINEAIQLKSVDITMASTRTSAKVYYNINKQKVKSRRAIAKVDLDDIVNYIADKAGSPIADKTARTPYSLSIDLDMHNRGRVEINRTFYGWMVTIRVLPNENLDKTLEDLNLSPNTISFLQDVVLSKEKGLRLFIGETCSGKNTTILATLLHFTKQDIYKIVSIEKPVELLVDGIEQIHVESEDEFTANAASLLRQNPDIVYISEITNYTAQHTMTTANTGKVVLSSIHANCIADVIARLQDITNLTADRILLSLQSCVYQELVFFPEEKRVRPINRCVHFSNELKDQLYGKPLGEIIKKLREVEEEWIS